MKPTLPNLKKPMNLKLKKGALHKALKISEEKDIPGNKLEVKENDTPLMKKRKQFALNAKKFHH